VPFSNRKQSSEKRRQLSVTVSLRHRAADLIRRTLAWQPYLSAIPATPRNAPSTPSGPTGAPAASVVEEERKKKPESAKGSTYSGT
jgi:hypothetical protein